MNTNNDKALYDAEAVNTRIRNYLKEYGVMKKEIAELIGKSPQRVSEILKEGSGKSFQVEDLLHICSRFGVSMDIILGRKPEGFEEICNTIVWLVDNGLVRISRVDVNHSMGNDRMLDVDDGEYDSLFFPYSYRHMKEEVIDDEYSCEPLIHRHLDYYDISKIGVEVNAFLQQYTRLLDMYNQNIIDSKQLEKGIISIIKYVTDTDCTPEKYLKLEKKLNSYR